MPAKTATGSQMLWQALRGVWLVIVAGRPITALVMGLSAAGVLSASGFGPALNCFARVAGLILTTMASFVLNDVWDRDCDRTAGKRRPIAEGTLSRRGAVTGGVALVLLGGVVELARGQSAPAIWLGSLAVAGVAYSPLAWHMPTSKNLLLGAVVAGGLLYAASIVNCSVSWLSLAALATFIAARELILDVRDLEPDLAHGRVTVAGYLGRRRSLVLGVVVLALSSLWFGIEARTFVYWIALMASSAVGVVIYRQSGPDAAMRIGSYIMLLASVLQIGKVVVR